MHRGGRPAALAGITFVVAAYAYGVYVASSLSLFCNLAGWHVDAMPAVLSHRLFDHPADYTHRSDVHATFYAALTGFGCESVDRAIGAVDALPREVASRYSLMGNDDKGVVDYVALAFALFGTRAQSLPLLYFGVLGMSLVALLVGQRANPGVCVAAGLLTYAHALLIPFTAYYGQLTSFLALRYFPNLALVALFHVLLSMGKPPSTPREYVALGFQASVIALVVSVRFSSMWMALTCMAIGAGGLVVTWIRSRTPSERRTGSTEHLRRAGVALLPMLFALCAVQWQASRMHVDYENGQQISGHVFWHSIVSGLSFSPRLFKRYAIKLDDVSVVAATGRYLVDSGRSAEWEAMGGTSEAYSRIRWAPYDVAARDLLIHICQQHPIDCISSVAIHKPLAWIGNVAWLSGMRSRFPPADRYDATVSDQASAARELLVANEWSGIASWQTLAVVLAAASILCLGKSVGTNVLQHLALASASSMLPSLIAYPAPHAVGEATILLWATACQLAALAIAVLYTRGSQR